jgi:hypothetical protein
VYKPSVSPIVALLFALSAFTVSAAEEKSFNPPSQEGNIFAVIGTDRTPGVITTQIEVNWASFSRHDILGNPYACVAGSGFVLMVRNNTGRTDRFTLSTTGTILRGPYQGEPPPELSDPCFRVETMRAIFPPPPPPSDTIPPSLQLPASTTESTASATGKAVTFQASATDGVDGPVAVNCIPSSGSMFPIGTTVVNCSASDHVGNQAHGIFTVTVLHAQAADTEPPVIVSIVASPSQMTSPSGEMKAVSVATQVVDNSDLAPVVRIFEIVANEPIAAGDVEITGPLTARLRVGGESPGSDRIYTIRIEAIDASGNRSTASTDVAVQNEKASPGTRRRSVGH